MYSQIAFKTYSEEVHKRGVRGDQFFKLVSQAE